MEDQALTPSAGNPYAKWAERLRSRGRMAVACIGGLAVLGIMGATNPLLGRITAAQTRLKKAEERGARRRAGQPAARRLCTEANCRTPSTRTTGRNTC